MAGAACRAAALAAAAFALGACSITAGPHGVDAAGPFLPPRPAHSESAAAAFHAVLVEGPVDVEIRVGGLDRVRFEGDEERLPELTAEVRDRTLIVRAALGAPWRDGPKVIVDLPRLTKLTSGGSGWITVVGLDEARLEVRVRGSGDVHLCGRVGEFVSTIDGSGRIDSSEVLEGVR